MNEESYDPYERLADMMECEVKEVRRCWLSLLLHSRHERFAEYYSTEELELAADWHKRPRGSFALCAMTVGLLKLTDNGTVAVMRKSAGARLRMAVCHPFSPEPDEAARPQ